MHGGSTLTTRYLEIIEELIMAQLYLIAALAVATLFLLRWRTWKANRVAVLKESYGESIADVVCGEDSELFVPYVRRFQFIKRQALKEALLDNIGSITGPERQVLIDAYIEHGLADIDIKSCSSVFWSTRLEGLMSLSQLGQKEFAPLFKHMQKDKTPLIASCAVLSLSYIDDQKTEPEEILDSLPASFFQNSNMLFELTNNFVRRFGLERFEEYVRTNIKTPVGQAIIAVLTNAQTPESTLFLLEIVTTTRFEDDRLRIRIERAIRESNDAVAIEQLDYFTSMRGAA